MSFLNRLIEIEKSAECVRLNIPRKTFQGEIGGWGWGGEGESYDRLYDEAPPERGTFLRLQVNHRVGVFLVEVYERVGKSVIMVSART